MHTRYQSGNAPDSGSMLSTVTVVTTAVICSLAVFALGVLVGIIDNIGGEYIITYVGILCYHCANVIHAKKVSRSGPTPPATLSPVVYEGVT